MAIFKIKLLNFQGIFPAHRVGVQEDAHEMLTLLLNALEPSFPKSSQQNGNGVKVGGGIPATPIEQIFGGNLRNEGSWLY